MTTTAEIKSKLLELHGELEHTVTGLTLSELHWKADAATWSVAQILAHVAEFEQFFSQDVLRLRDNPGTSLGRTMDHADRVQAVQLTGTESLQDLLRSIEQSRQVTVDMLDNLSDADLLAEGSHPKFGVRTIEWEIGHFLTEHLEKHIGQVNRTKLAYQQSTVD
ncbi:DinB family protein [Alicyclobacillus fastidiosus]|uniref:DinB family protein n=1 Tax=Alicyclobacillus fastidiosus TaxID=392011 RepID=A0ABV5A902_9BACL|nr:DinB family protein [Alicyclobacillus fastidiosus]WEH10705.1 DinB family protein [Alicyclobacillus fastidiosus]